MAVKILTMMAEEAIVVLNKALYFQGLVHLSDQCPSYRSCVLSGLATRVTVVLPEFMFELEKFLPSLLVTITKIVSLLCSH